MGYVGARPPRTVVLCALLLAGACADGEIGGGRGDEPPIILAPSADGRRVARLSAEQFQAALTVATGKPWPDFEAAAATMGRPDFLEVIEEGREMSVAFTKLIGEAARRSCGEAIDDDLGNADERSRVILRYASNPNPHHPSTTTTLRYLLLRFHGFHITSDADARLDPWLELLRSGISPTAEVSWTDMRERWRAVCVGLATHADFLTY